MILRAYLCLLLGVFSAPLFAQNCPIEFTYFQVRRADPGDPNASIKFGKTKIPLKIDPHGEEISSRAKNLGTDKVLGIVFRISYLDAMRKLVEVPHDFEYADPIKPGKSSTYFSLTAPWTAPPTAAGWIVQPRKVLFEGGATWEVAGDDCRWFFKSTGMKHKSYDPATDIGQ